MEITKNYVYYEDFGAVGDGVTDDIAAIQAAHAYANEKRLPVKAKPGATYYIKNCTTPAVIMTNTDFTGAKFTIDDRGIERGSDRAGRIFTVAPEMPRFEITDREVIGKIFGGYTLDRKNLKKINWKEGYPALLVPRHHDSKKYIRYGNISGNTGHMQRELISIDKDGNVSPDTPLLFDYEDINSVLVMRTDDESITVMGGEFTTIANDVPQTSCFYISRGFGVKRSNATLKNIKHYVTGELPGDTPETKGCSYSAFIFVEDCQDVTITDCTFTARKNYGLAGTYDLNVCQANRLTVKYCSQTNFYLEDGHTPSMLNFNYWGLAASNYSKNLTYDHCELSRFDAHEGVWNGKIKDSKISSVEIIGGGEMLIENTTFVPFFPCLIMLRSDYGSTWRGNLTIKNCHAIDDDRPLECLVRATYLNHYFGYTCYMPNVYIDNLTLRNPKRELEVIKIYNNGAPGENVSLPVFSNGEENKNPYVPPREVKVTGDTEGIKYFVASDGFFENTDTFGVEKR